MALVPGTRLGAYDVVSLLGEGGMGQVYRARDTKLGRDVALKILPEAFALDGDRIARFRREAQVLAALNHPNIAAIYGFEDSGATHALVLELVEGPTLADRITKGPIPLDEALPIAKQIAEALEAAHEQGIIHRDLKPANIKVRDDGTVKVLDFGLAKALEPASAISPMMTAAPTITTPAQLTGVGTILGTAAYMSPEQAKGRPADKRSDVWAFGCVLYEMLTGTRAFEGEDISDTLANVLKTPPDFTRLPAAIPPYVARVLRRCLEKDANKRVHHVADVRLDIEDTSGNIFGTPIASATRSRRPVFWMAAGAVIVALVMAGAWAVSQSRVQESPAIVRSVVVMLSLDGATTNGFQGIAIAPDGQRLVYAAGGALYLRSLDDIDAQILRGSEGGTRPGFSPDGQSVAFFVPSQSAIKRLLLRGGPATTVTTTDGGNPGGLSWARDDTIVFATATSGGLWRVPAAGGKAEQLTRVAPGEALGHLWPSVLPDGRGVLFEAFRGASSKIGFVSLQGGHDITFPVSVGRTPHYSPTGHIIYLERDGLHAVGFDASRLVVTAGDRTALAGTEQVDTDVAGNFDLAANGSLIYVTASAVEMRTLVWVGRDGRETPLALPPRRYGTFRISPEGTRIAADIRDAPRPPAIWITEVNRPGWTRVASSHQEGGDWFPKWTPDGRRVVFSAFGARVPSLVSASADGTGEVEPLLTIDNSPFIDARGWSRDGQSLFFTYGTPASPRIGLLSMTATGSGRRNWKPFIERGDGALAGPLSPDGDWIVTESFQSGSPSDIYVERFPGLGDRHRVSTESGGRNAVWSPDGRELFYRRNTDEAMMAVNIQTRPALKIGDPRVLFPAAGFGRLADSRAWDVAPDGRFLMSKPTTNSGDAARQLVLVQNWFEELKQRVPLK